MFRYQIIYILRYCSDTYCLYNTIVFIYKNIHIMILFKYQIIHILLRYQIMHCLQYWFDTRTDPLVLRYCSDTRSDLSFITKLFRYQNDVFGLSMFALIGAAKSTPTKSKERILSIF